MIPGDFIVSEAIIKGIRILEQTGLYAYTEVVCVHFAAFGSEGVVPAIRAVKLSDIETRNKPNTFMLFGGQATSEDGGIASYIILELFPVDCHPLIIPDHAEVKYLSWDYPAKS